MRKKRSCNPITAALTLIVVLLTLMLFGKSLKAQENESDELVILLHGLGRTSNSMAALGEHLAQHGYKVINIDYPSRSLTVEQISAQYLQPAIVKRENISRIHFVSHSMGGIVVRQFLQSHPDTLPGRIVMLAPPNGGSEIIDRFGGYSIFKTVMGPAAAQLATSQGSLVNILPTPRRDTGIIAGTRSYNPLFSSVIAGEDDGKVSVASTTLPTMKDHLILPVSHTFMMNDQRVKKATVNFLQYGMFQSRQESLSY